MTTRTPDSSSVRRCPVSTARLPSRCRARGRGRSRCGGAGGPSRAGRRPRGRRRRCGRAAGRGHGRRRRRRRRRSRAPRPTCRRSSGSSARRRPMRPRSRSTSTTRTWISSPLLRTSSTVSTRWPGDDVGDVQQAVGALGELDERAEGRRLDDLAGELVADLDLLGHRADALGERLAQLAVGGVDEHLALVVDVDLRLELVRQAADRLAALADEQADLVRVDLDGEDPRRVRRQLARAARR